MSEVPRALKEIVRERANHLCEYCQSSEWLSGQPGHMDHIIPLKRSGETTADNLCLACPHVTASNQILSKPLIPKQGKPRRFLIRERSRGAIIFNGMQRVLKLSV